MKKCPCDEMLHANFEIDRLSAKIEELRKNERAAQDLLQAKEKDLVALARRCAALSETLKAAVKERK